MATAAQAVQPTEPYENGYYAGNCLDSNTSRDVYLRGCNGGSFQKWINTSSSQLKNLATSYCLDSNSSGSVYTLGCNSGNFQKWRFVNLQWANVATGLCLDVNSSGNPYTHACNNGTRQLWLPR
jgi:serine/threonine-protein kinase